MAGRIEQLLTGETNPKRIAEIKARGIAQDFAGLPAGQRASFTFDGMLVTVTAMPKLLADGDGNIVGLQVEARGRDASGPLPLVTGIHRVINPPVLVPDGTTRTDTLPDGTTVQVPNYNEDSIKALKTWLVESIRAEARAAGWRG